MFKLGLRRVQALGGGLFVNLPLVWTRNHGIEKGQTVNIDVQDDGSLKISPMGGA